MEMPQLHYILIEAERQMLNSTTLFLVNRNQIWKGARENQRKNGNAKYGKKLFRKLERKTKDNLRRISKIHQTISKLLDQTSKIKNIIKQHLPTYQVSQPAHQICVQTSNMPGSQAGISLQGLMCHQDSNDLSYSQYLADNSESGFYVQNLSVFVSDDFSPFGCDDEDVGSFEGFYKFSRLQSARKDK